VDVGAHESAADGPHTAVGGHDLLGEGTIEQKCSIV
jgi:hypothetical protein